MILGSKQIEVDDVILQKAILASFPKVMSGTFRIDAAHGIVKLLHELAEDDAGYGEPADIITADGED